MKRPARQIAVILDHEPDERACVEAVKVVLERAARRAREAERKAAEQAATPSDPDTTTSRAPAAPPTPARSGARKPKATRRI